MFFPLSILNVFTMCAELVFPNNSRAEEAASADSPRLSQEAACVPEDELLQEHKSESALLEGY